MRHHELKPFFKAMLPALPGFVGHKRLLLKNPIDGLLRAIHFDPSGFDKNDFYVQPIIMPMCVPTEYLHLTFGHRIRPFGWSLTMPNLADELLRDINARGLPFLERAGSYLSAVDVIAEFSANPHAPKEMAFLLARAGETNRAIRLIDSYLPKLNLARGWEKDMFDISTYLRDLLIEDPAAAHRQLLAWEDYTLGKLKLEAFR